MKSFRQHGYLLIEDFFSTEEVANVLRDAKNVFLRQFIEKQYLPPCKLEDVEEQQFNQMMYRLFDEDLECLSNCGKQVQHLMSLHTLSLDKKITALLVEAGLKSPIISTRPVMFFNHPRLAKQKVFYKVDAHQDWRSMQGSLNSVVIWIPLIDINKDLGALEIVPGSHHDGLRTDHVENSFGMVSLTDADTNKIISVEVKAGDVLLFSAFLIHQSGENITDKPRWSCHFRYNDLDEPSFIKRKFAHPYLYKPMDDLITKDFPGKDDLLRIYN